MRIPVMCLFLLCAFWTFSAAAMGTMPTKEEPVPYEEAPAKRGRVSLDPEVPGLAGQPAADPK